MSLSQPLSDLVLPSRANESFKFSGLDSPDLCEDREHFENYPYDITYTHNSRGFRDAEWPDDLVNAVWCLGDSFTVGMGSPWEHTWVYNLQSRINTRCINISMDGASNDWISRRACQIIKEVNPKLMVIHWSYLHRAESTDTSKSDEDRRLDFTLDSIDTLSQIKNFNKNFYNVESIRTTTKVIYSHIPASIPMVTLADVNKIWDRLKGDLWPECPGNLDEFQTLPKSIKSELKEFGCYQDVLDLLHHLGSQEYQAFTEYFKNIFVISDLEQLDNARDGLHYDIKTAKKLVDKIVELL